MSRFYPLLFRIRAAGVELQIMERTHDAFEVVSAASMWQKAATGNDEAIVFAREPGRVSISP